MNQSLKRHLKKGKCGRVAFRVCYNNEEKARVKPEIQSILFNCDKHTAVVSQFTVRVRRIVFLHYSHFHVYGVDDLGPSVQTICDWLSLTFIQPLTGRRLEAAVFTRAGVRGQQLWRW